MNRHQYKNLTIEVIDEPTYKFGSTDNNFNFSKHYFGDGATEYLSSKHGIKIYQDGQIIESCIIIGSGGATDVHQNSSLLDKDQLIICCSDTIFCLTLPDLELKWKTQTDQVTCFQIFKKQDDYIIHGELQVVKLDKDGKIKWEFGGADIFVSIDNEEEFKIENDGILLTDFAKTKYKIDFEGKLIWDTYKR
jgi:outer membrane protein assembly factor BamB